MAELIERGKLLEKLVLSHTAHANNSREERLLNRDVRIVMEQPIITTAEIRAKAIEEFAERLGILCENSAMALDRYNGRPLYNKDGKWHDLINDVAEQLKEK